MDKKTAIIGVIGCGNMASAIVKGIHQKFGEIHFITYTPSFTRAHKLAESVAGAAVKELSGLNECNTLIIGCKPQQFKDLAFNLVQQVPSLKDKHIISIMAAVPAATICHQLGVEKVTRVMPNTPSLVGEGVSLVFHLPAVAATAQAEIESYFSACSSVHPIKDEDLFNQVTTVTGSGPAYVYYFAKTFTDSLTGWGVSEVEARKMVTQLFRGATELMEANGHRPLDELISEVCSKGGVTIEAVNVYQARGLEQLTSEALAAACKRSKELQV